MPPLSEDPCKNTGETELRSSGLTADIQKMCPKPIVVCATPRPPCNRCQIKREQRMRYIQPEIPASYKPESRYKCPAYPFESGTVYRLSYSGVDGEVMKNCKPSTTHPMQDNICLSNLPFSQETTFRLSYTGVPGEKSESHKPVYKNLLGTGPMQSITTHRHDYTPKISEKAVQRKMDNNIHLSTARMENATTMSLSYQPAQVEKPCSYKPLNVYKKSDYKVEQDTINRLSYQPWDPMPKEVYPWMQKEKYRQPCRAMENHTIYRASYLPVDNFERMPSYKPQACVGPVGSNKPFSNATIYRESYQDNGLLERPTPVVRKENIFLSTQPMSQDTTARLSYTGVGGEKAIPYKPTLRSMMGIGPMQSVTTQRHDYTPKPIVLVDNFKPHQTLMTSNFKMDDTTTFRASYLPNDVMPKTENYKPVNVYRKSPYALESDTINRLSYQPWSPMPKEDYPWMKKPKYEQPCRLMEGTSIYRGSYLAPGNCVPESTEHVQEEECDCQKLICATEDL